MNAEAFTPFPEIIAGHASARPDAIAFQVEDRALDWKSLHERVGEVARSLIRDGIAPGDRVALLGPASIEYMEFFFGAIAARACVVPLPTSASAETLDALLADCGAKVVFSGKAIGRTTNSAPLPQAREEDPFNIIYSSGTTGVPKGIVHEHGMRQRQGGRKGFFSTASRTLLSTPPYSNTTLTPLLGTLANGGTCILMPKFDAGRWLALARKHRVTHTMLVPVQYKRILAHADFDRGELFLELSQCTGAPMEASLKREIVQRWPGRVREIYGLTEGGGSCFLDLHEHPDKLATVGKPGHGSEVFLIDEAGRRLPSEAGVTGEVVGRSPYMMREYYNRPEATAQMRWLDEQGRIYHRSGDVGRFDADGFLTLLDRIKDVIISGGHNIYAADLEAMLARHEDVQEAAVIGVPSEQWGETPLALVVPRAGARVDAAVLRDWVNERVGKTQRLSAVELRDELPRSALGKLSKKELRAPYWKEKALP